MLISHYYGERTNLAHRFGARKNREILPEIQPVFARQNCCDWQLVYSLDTL